MILGCLGAAICQPALFAGSATTIKSDTIDTGPKVYSDDETTDTAMFIKGAVYYVGNHIDFQTSYGFGIQSSGGHFVYLDNCNFVVVRDTDSHLGEVGFGMRLAKMVEKSKLSNSHISLTTGRGNRAYGVYLDNSDLEIDDVRVVDDNSVYYGIYGIASTSDSKLTGSHYQYTGIGAGLLVSDTSSAVLDYVTIDSKAGNGAVFLSGNATTVLNHANIDSTDTAIYAEGSSSSGTISVTLTDGRLNAKNAVLNKGQNYNQTLNVDLLNYDMTGQVQTMGNNSVTNLSMTNSHWTVTEVSQVTTFSLDSASSLTFNQVKGNLTSIAALAVLLESGSILQIDVDGSLVEVGDRFTLFTGLSDAFDNEGARLVTADGEWEFVYINPLDGVFEIVGAFQLVPIPEPASAAFGLIGLSLALLRRRQLS